MTASTAADDVEQLQLSTHAPAWAGVGRATAQCGAAFPRRQSGA
jgi:hypothetical protein